MNYQRRNKMENEVFFDGWIGESDLENWEKVEND
jgi:hypothetical protein